MRTLLLSIALIGLASPVLSEECKYFQGAIRVEDDVQPTKPTGAYLQLIGNPLKSVLVHWSHGEVESCPASWGDSGGRASCSWFDAIPGGEALVMLGPTINTSLGEEILIFAGTAWYRDSKCKS